MWKCNRCGKCCKFIVIPVMEPVDLDTEDYLEAHGIVYDGNKIIVPAVCKYLEIEWHTDLKQYKYRCKIHADKFVNCRLGGEKECKEAQKAWTLLHSK